MIRIFQENGEVVCCIGSSLNFANTTSFASADFAIALEPFHIRHSFKSAANHSPSNPTSSNATSMSSIALASSTSNFNFLPSSSATYSHFAFALGASLISLPCALTMHSESSPYVLTQIIKEARNYEAHAKQVFVFSLVFHGSMVVLNLLSMSFMHPMIFVGFQQLWLQWLVIPLLSLPFLFCHEIPESMKMMPGNLHTPNSNHSLFVGKNKDHLNDLLVTARFHALRCVPIIGMTFALFLLCAIACIFTDFCCRLINYFFAITNSQRHLRTTAFPLFASTLWISNQEAAMSVLCAQSLSMFFFVYYQLMASASFMYRTQPIWCISPLKNKLWVALSLIMYICRGVLKVNIAYCSIACQLGFCFITLLNVYDKVDSGIAWILVLGFLWGIVVMAVQESIKLHDTTEFIRVQKRRKLEFNTKLGCYSPV